LINCRFTARQHKMGQSVPVHQDGKAALGVEDSHEKNTLQSLHDKK
jgi:hypothetical protein